MRLVRGLLSREGDASDGRNATQRRVLASEVIDRWRGERPLGPPRKQSPKQQGVTVRAAFRGKTPFVKMFVQARS
jgi:hypothetical protein